MSKVKNKRGLNNNGGQSGTVRKKEIDDLTVKSVGL